jgi:epoxyqueuosine reductase
VRNGLDNVTLAELFGWSEDEFHARLLGSAIHRIGYARWLRNLAVGMGNALRELPGASADSQRIRAVLRARSDDASALVREHVAWALQQQPSKP